MKNTSKYFFKNEKNKGRVGMFWSNKLNAKTDMKGTKIQISWNKLEKITWNFKLKKVERDPIKNLFKKVDYNVLFFATQK